MYSLQQTGIIYRYNEDKTQVCGDWGPTLGPPACTAAADKNSHAVSPLACLSSSQAVQAMSIRL